MEFTAENIIMKQAENFEYLDELARKFGTDKGTSKSNELSPKGYTRAYAQYFDSLRDKKITILEIGVDKGASLKMWEEFFPEARIYGIDINLDCKQYETGRVKIFIGDQTDINFLQKVVVDTQGKFDIIVDDGGHKMRQHQVTLEFLFEHLKSGGFYFIEDLHTAYWGSYGGGYRKRSSTVEYLKNLVDQINETGIRIEENRFKSFLKLFIKQPVFPKVLDQVSSVHFYRSLAVLLKN